MRSDDGQVKKQPGCSSGRHSRGSELEGTDRDWIRMSWFEPFELYILRPEMHEQRVEECLLVTAKRVSLK